MKHARLLTTLMVTGAAVAPVLLVFENARAGGGPATAPDSAACCGQVPNVDGHWRLVLVSRIGMAVVCRVGEPRICWHLTGWQGVGFIPSGQQALAGTIRELQGVFQGMSRPGSTGNVSLIAVNSQLMLANTSPGGPENRGEKGPAEVTIGEMIEGLSIDPKSIVVPIKKSALAGSSLQMGWVADTRGNIYQVPSKEGTLFPPQLLSCTGATLSHDQKLMKSTERANAILKRVADSNTDPEKQLSILMIHGRAVVAWVNKTPPKTRATLGPTSSWEQIQSALQIKG